MGRVFGWCGICGKLGVESMGMVVGSLVGIGNGNIWGRDGENVEGSVREIKRVDGCFGIK